MFDGLWRRARNPIESAPAPVPAAAPEPALAANHLGAGLIIGRDVITSGALSPAHVGLRIGDNCHIFAGCKLMIDLISASSGITLGRNVAMNFNCYIDGSGGVEIGGQARRLIFDLPQRLVRAHVHPTSAWSATGIVMRADYNNQRVAKDNRR